MRFLALSKERKKARKKESGGRSHSQRVSQSIVDSHLLLSLGLGLGLDERERFCRFGRMGCSLMECDESKRERREMPLSTLSSLTD